MCKMECSLCGKTFDTKEPMWLDKKLSHSKSHENRPMWVKVWE